MTSLFLLMMCLVYVVAYGSAQENPELCEMEIKPGVFEGHVVHNGQYIETYNAKYMYSTVEECMQGCCDQSQNHGDWQVACNTAYFYQELDPNYQDYRTRKVCLWWNCAPGDCASSDNFDPNTPFRIGRMSVENKNTEDTVVQTASSYGAAQSGDQYPAGTQQNPQNSGQQQYGVSGQSQSQASNMAGQNTQYQDTYADQDTQNGQENPIAGTQNGQYSGQNAQNSQYQNQGEQNSQYQTQDAQNSQYQPQDAQNSQYQAQDAQNSQSQPQDAQNSQYQAQDAQNSQYQNQGTQTDQYQGQNQAAAANEPPQQSGTQPAQMAGTPGQWLQNPSTGKYVFVYPDGSVASQGETGSQSATGQGVAVAQDDGGYKAATGHDIQSEQGQMDGGMYKTANDTSTVNETTTMPGNTSAAETEDGDNGWGFWNWWNGDNNDDDAEDDDEHWDDDEDDDEEWEGEWQEEEDKEEQEWEQELAQWEAEVENGTTSSPSDSPNTTLNPEEVEELQEEEEEWQQDEAEEEQEIAAWLSADDDTPSNSTDTSSNAEETAGSSDEATGDDGAPKNEPVEPIESGPSVDNSQYYKPETFPSSHESSWAANAPVIAVGTCAGVVLIMLIIILLGKKLTGNSDRAQYKPLRESFSGSSTYHEDI